MLLENVILRDDRASQPAANTVPAGTLYYVTDENVTERSTGAAWEDFSDVSGGGTVTTTGSPANGNLTKFSGASSITNADLTGDVTTSGGVATTIANNAVTTAKILDDNVTYAKIQDVSATDRILLRDTAGAGVIEEGTATSGLEFSGAPGLRVTAATRTRTLGITIDGGGSTITTGVKGYISFPVAGTITAVRMLADQSGSAVVDIWKDTFANYPPTDADSITASAVPTISSATNSEDTTLTGWTTSVSAGDVFGFNVDSATSIQRLTVTLTIVASGA